jgi:hypothetical protein
MPRAAFPRLFLRCQDVAEIKALGGAVVELDLDLGAGVRHQHQVAFGSERRVVDRAKRRQHQVAAGEANALAQPPRQLRRGKSLAADQPGEIAGADENQRFALHRQMPPRWTWILR